MTRLRTGTVQVKRFAHWALRFKTCFSSSSPRRAKRILGGGRGFVKGGSGQSFDHPARHPVAGVTSRVCDLVIRTGVNHEGGAVFLKKRVFTLAQG